MKSYHSRRSVTEPVLTVLVAILVALIPTCSHSQVFRGPLQCDVQGWVTGLSVADIDRDGHVDMAIIEQTSGDSLNLKFGNGDGSFEDGPSYALGGRALGITSALINSDSFPDFVVAYANPNHFKVFFGRSGRRIELSYHEFSISLPIGTFRVEDINNDGYEDLVVLSSSVDSLIVFDGDYGSFRRARTIPLGFRGDNFSIVSIDGDSFIDLVVANSDNRSISVFLGAEAGNFLPAGSYSLPNIPRRLAVGDFDGDGWKDIASSDSAGSIVYGFSDGTFGNLKEFQFQGIAFAFASADFDQDGRDDLAWTTYESARRRLYTLFQRSNELLIEERVLPRGLSFGGIVTNDVNGDGREDIFAGGYGCNCVTIFPGEPGGTFVFPVNLTAGIHPAPMFSGKFNNDPFPDFVVLNISSHDVSIFSNDSGRSFTHEIVATDVQFSGVEQVADFDRDGFDDFLSWKYSDSTLRIHKCDGEASFLSPKTIAKVPMPVRYLATDISGDAIVDLVESDLSPSSPLKVRLGIGGGEFAPSYSLQLFNPETVMTAGDYDKDGRKDLVTQDGNSLNVRLNDSLLQFQRFWEISLPHYVFHVATADFNEDQNLDMAFAGYTFYSGQHHAIFGIARGKGNGTFWAIDTIYQGSTFVRVLAADFDSDGHQDVAVSDRELNTISIFLGLGDGSFKSPQVYFCDGELPTGMVSEDFNGDNSPDLFVAMELSSSIACLYNRVARDNCCFRSTGNLDCDPAHVVDISDLLVLVDKLFLNFGDICCDESAEVDGTPGVDIGDLIRLVDHLFITFQPLPSCN